MPKASKDESWNTQPPPSTALQRGAFIDRCMEWLTKQSPPSDGVHVAEKTVFDAFSRSEYASPGETQLSASIGVSRSEISLYHFKQCAFCESVNGRGLAVNPYANKDIVVVCKRCMQ